MNRLDLLTGVGLVLGSSLIIWAIVIGGTLQMYWNFPAILITVGGSFAALMVSYDLKQVKGVFNTVRHVLTSDTPDPQQVIQTMTELAKKARREGLLALEDDVNRYPDPFFQRGVRMMVDALDPELIREVLETEIEYTQRRHELGQGIFRTWAALSPAFGMIGTLIGLIAMLAKLDDPAALGPGMAVALITTFYGTIMANLVFTPIANKLNLRSKEELLLKEMILEAIISIQSGMNPRILEEKLTAFLSPKANKENAGSREERSSIA